MFQKSNRPKTGKKHTKTHTKTHKKTSGTELTEAEAKDLFETRKNRYPPLKGAEFHIHGHKRYNFWGKGERNGKKYYNYSRKVKKYTKKGNRVFYIGGSGKYLVVTNNIYARNPTYNELKKFLEKCRVNSHEYKYHSYVCADFAKDLHNRAEEAGIACVIISISFYESSEGHMLNGFIVDGKWMFIDATPSRNPLPFNTTRIMELGINKEYRGRYMFPSGGYSSLPMGRVRRIEVFDRFRETSPAENAGDSSISSFSVFILSFSLISFFLSFCCSFSCHPASCHHDLKGNLEIQENGF